MRRKATTRARPGLAELHKMRLVDPVCCECGGLGRLTSGLKLFPGQPRLHRLAFYACPCGARVGCHPGTGIALGRPAGGWTRRLRREAHEVFDALWRGPGGRSGRAATVARHRAYRRLAAALGIDLEDCHFGQFDRATCERAIEICKGFAAGGET